MKDPNVAEAQWNRRKVAKNEPDEVGKGQILQGPAGQIQDLVLWCTYWLFMLPAQLCSPLDWPLKTIITQVPCYFPLDLAETGVEMKIKVLPPCFTELSLVVTCLSTVTVLAVWTLFFELTLSELW